MPEMTVAKISKNKIEIKDFSGNEIKPQMLKLDWDINESTKGGYPFYMEKEICEQPKVLKKTIEKRIVDFLPDFRDDGIDDNLFKNCRDISVIA